MPQKLSQRPEEFVRQYIIDNARPSEMAGYDPQQTDTQATDFMPVTTSYSKWGETFPMVWVGETDGPVIPNAGETNYNSIQGDDSGANTRANHNITVSVQTTEGGAYLNSTDYDDLAFDIYSEIRYQMQQELNLSSETIFDGALTPGTPVRSPTEEDGDTFGFYQLQGTVPLGVIYTP